MGNFGGLGGLGGLGGPASGPSLRVTMPKGKNKGDPVVMGLLKSTMFPLQQVLEGENAGKGVCEEVDREKSRFHFILPRMSNAITRSPSTGSRFTYTIELYAEVHTSLGEVA